MADYAQIEQLLREAVAIIANTDDDLDRRDWLKEAHKALIDEPTFVWVLFHETNSGHGDDSDGYVEDVYATEALADAAKLAEIRRLVAEGEDVCWNPDAPEGQQEGPDDWTDDFRVIPRRVLTAVAATDPNLVTCPKCQARPYLACVWKTTTHETGEAHAARIARAKAIDARATKAVQP